MSDAHVSDINVGKIPTFDGLLLTVQFYANHGALRQVSERTGISKTILEAFADGKRKLTEEEREIMYRHSEHR